MTSYHEYNKIEKGHKLVQMLLEGKNLALITDAGTPGISDPGEELVQMCYEAGVPVTSLPGAAACITALTYQDCHQKICLKHFSHRQKRTAAGTGRAEK